MLTVTQKWQYNVQYYWLFICLEVWGLPWVTNTSAAALLYEVTEDSQSSSSSIFGISILRDHRLQLFVTGKSTVPFPHSADHPSSVMSPCQQVKLTDLVFCKIDVFFFVLPLCKFTSTNSFKFRVTMTSLAFIAAHFPSLHTSNFIQNRV